MVLNKLCTNSLKIFNNIKDDELIIYDHFFNHITNNKDIIIKSLNKFKVLKHILILVD